MSIKSAATTCAALTWREQFGKHSDVRRDGDRKHVAGKAREISCTCADRSLDAGGDYLHLLSPETRARLLAKQVSQTDTRQGGASDSAASPVPREGS